MEQLLEFIRFNQYNLPVILSVLAILLAGVWVAITVWVLRDITTRTKNILVIVTLTMLVLVINIPGLIIYLLVRPSHTLEEDKQRELFYSSILDTEVTTCRHCQTMVRREYDHCPNCGRDVSHNCPNCDAHLNPMWKYCIECGKYVGPERKFHNFKLKLADKLKRKTETKTAEKSIPAKDSESKEVKVVESKQRKFKLPSIKFSLPKPKFSKPAKQEKQPEVVKPNQVETAKSIEEINQAPNTQPTSGEGSQPSVYADANKNKFKKKSRKDRRRADAGRKRGPYQKPVQFEG